MTLALGWSFATETSKHGDLGDPMGAAMGYEDSEWGADRGASWALRCGIAAIRSRPKGRPDPFERGRWAVAQRARGFRYQQLLNEPNLVELEARHDVEGWPAERHADGSIDLDATAAACAAWLEEAIDAAGPARAIGAHGIALTPMSPGVGRRSVERWLKAHKAVAARCSALVAHCYGDPAQMWDALEPVLELGRHLKLPILIGECAPRADQEHDAWGRDDLPVFADRVARTAPEVEALCVFAPLWDKPDGGFTRPVRFIGTAVERWLRSWRPPPAEARPAPAEEAPMRVALASGHHNSSGGDPREIALMGPYTDALADELRARGAEVRVVQPDDGRGTVAGSVFDVGRAAAAWDAGGWPIDYLIELHGQAVGSPTTRGCFVIYPDKSGDVDVDVRDVLGPAIAKRIAAATGVPVWGTGTLPESRTAATSAGGRLGFFAGSVAIAAHATRMLIEVGTYTNPSEHLLMQAPEFAGRLARAIADALMEHKTGVAVPLWRPPPTPRPTPAPAPIARTRAQLAIGKGADEAWGAAAKLDAAAGVLATEGGRVGVLLAATMRASAEQLRPGAVLAKVAGGLEAA